MLSALLGAMFLAAVTWFAVPRASDARVRSLVPTDPTRRRLVRFGMITGRSQLQQHSHRRLVVGLRSLASELTAGSHPLAALERSAGVPPLWPQALAAARFGDAVDRGLLLDAHDNEVIASQLRQLAACWRMGSVHGSGLALSVERLALSVQSQFELHSLLRSELAAPRATARMLALLPIVGIVMGYLLGANPIAWFLGSTIGALVLLCAVALTITGAFWTRRIVRRVEIAATRG